MKHPDRDKTGRKTATGDRKIGKTKLKVTPENDRIEVQIGQIP